MFWLIVVMIELTGYAQAQSESDCLASVLMHTNLQGQLVVAESVHADLDEKGQILRVKSPINLSCVPESIWKHARELFGTDPISAQQMWFIAYELEADEIERFLDPSGKLLWQLDEGSEKETRIKPQDLPVHVQRYVSHVRGPGRYRVLREQIDTRRIFEVEWRTPSGSHELEFSDEGLPFLWEIPSFYSVPANIRSEARRTGSEVETVYLYAYLLSAQSNEEPLVIMSNGVILSN